MPAAALLPVLRAGDLLTERERVLRLVARRSLSLFDDDDEELDVDDDDVDELDREPELRDDELLSDELLMGEFREVRLSDYFW